MQLDLGCDAADTSGHAVATRRVSLRLPNLVAFTHDRSPDVSFFGVFFCKRLVHPFFVRRWPQS